MHDCTEWPHNILANLFSSAKHYTQDWFMWVIEFHNRRLVVYLVVFISHLFAPRFHFNVNLTEDRDD